MKIYVAGPIFGTGPSRNVEAFRSMAQIVQNQLCATAVVPHDIPPIEHSGSCPEGIRSEGAEHNAPCYLRADIEQLVRCDGVALLAGWHLSRGTKAELDVAVACGLLIYSKDSNGLLRKVN